MYFWEVKDYLKNVYLKGKFIKVPFLVGHAGEGKSSLIEKGLGVPCHTLFASNLGEKDLSGFPYSDKDGEYKYAVYSHLKEVNKLADENPNTPVVFFIDEFNRVMKECQNELIELLLCKSINGYKLRKNVVFCLAGNPEDPDFEYNTLELGRALNDRLLYIEFKNDIKEWSMSMASRIHEDVIEFVNTHPEKFQNYKAEYIESNKFGKNFPTPRSWEDVSNYYKCGILDTTLGFEVIRGCVGDVAGTAFINFIRENKKDKLPDVEVFIKENIGKKDLDKKYISWIKKENNIRLITFSGRILSYLKDKKHKSEVFDVIEKYLEAVDEHASADLVLAFYKNLNEKISGLDGDTIKNVIFKNSDFRAVSNKYLKKINEYGLTKG